MTTADSVDTRPGPPAAPSSHLAGLNEAQRLAVETVDGPVLVLAGAGTGKTRVLTTRLAHILLTGRAAPHQILAVTFTNKAALEMKERIAQLIGRPVEGWWLGTFHALAARILRRHAELVGLKPNFTILDTDDQIRLVKQVLAGTGIDDRRWPARAVLGVIERWKDRGLTPDKVSAAEQGALAEGRILDLYRRYQERLATLNACDFGDLLLHNLTLFQADPETLRRYQAQFRYLLVDEYQDTNVAQYLWLRLLAQGHRNLCCVGDDDQSIYGWRGAEVGNILKFEHDFPGARIVRLERNYRSTAHILGAASGLIAQNEGRLGKTLWTEGNEGEKISVRALWNGEAEAMFVSDEIESLQRGGVAFGEIAVLVRASSQTREFEERFLKVDIPYQLIGGPRFYERQEIRDAIAYLRLIHQPADDLAFERIVNTPRRGIGDATLRVLHRLARAESITLTTSAAKLVDSDELKPAARRALATFLEDLARWRGLAQSMELTKLLSTVLVESGYADLWKGDSPEAQSRQENLNELSATVEDFENLGGFLEHVSLVMETAASTGADKVSVMTLHSAKGLEFDVVFLPGWEEGLFPHQRALDESGTVGLEEERRLAYVGLTRARKRAYVSFVVNRRTHGATQIGLMPSRFVTELPTDHIEMVSDIGEQVGRAGFSDWGVAGSDHSRFGQGCSPAAARPRRAEAPVIEGEAQEIGRERSATYAAGTRIFHRKFGYGRVTHADGDKLDIAFDKAGSKKVMASFVVPAEQAG